MSWIGCFEGVVVVVVEVVAEEVGLARRSVSSPYGSYGSDTKLVDTT